MNIVSSIYYAKNIIIKQYKLFSSNNFIYIYYNHDSLYKNVFLFGTLYIYIYIYTVPVKTVWTPAFFFLISHLKVLYLMKKIKLHNSFIMLNVILPQ